jgi:hypothetical protein
MRSAFGVSIAALFLVAAAGSADARDMTLPIERSAVISSDGDHRVLFALGDRERLHRMYIDAAYLVLTLPPGGVDLPSEPIEIYVYGVTHPWNENADWDRGWNEPGGDLDVDVYARTTIRPDALGATLRIPIGTILRESVQAERLFGMLATVAPHRGRGLNSDELSLFSNVAAGNVEVSWTPRPRRPPRHND